MSFNKFSDAIIPEIKLSALIDLDHVRSMMESFYDLTGIPMSLTDNRGTLLASAGWQEICKKFHRADPRTEENCLKSGMKLTSEIENGEFRLYKCRNGLWDMATPLFFGQHRIGYLFSGQFLFSDDKTDTDFFKNQALKYDFNVDEYLQALQKVPRVERSYIEKAERFFVRMADVLAQLGYNRLRLEKALDDTRVLLTTVKQNKYLLEETQSIANLGSWELDLQSNRLTWTDEVYKIFGMKPVEFDNSFEGFLTAVHPDDKLLVLKAYSDSISEGSDTYEIEHRIIKSSGEIRWVHEKCRHFRDIKGEIVRSVGMVQDITVRKNAETLALESRQKQIIARHHYRRRMLRVRLQPNLYRKNRHQNPRPPRQFNLQSRGKR